MADRRPRRDARPRPGSTRCSRPRRWSSSAARAASARRRSRPRSARWPRPRPGRPGARAHRRPGPPAGRRARPRRARQRRATRVPDEAFAAAGVEPRGELWAAMLDTKAGWDDLIRRHAPDAEVRDAVLANPLYQNITSRFVHSHDYLAMEQLHDLHAIGRLRPRHRRHAAVAQRARRARRARRGWSSSSAAACCAGSPCRTGRGCSRRRRSPSTRSPIACSAPGSCRTSPSSSSSSRRWRRASSPAPARSRRCSATRAPTFLVVIDARDGAGPRGRVPRPRAASTRDYAPRRDRRQPRPAGGAHAPRRGDAAPGGSPTRPTTRLVERRRRRARAPTARPSTAASCATCSPRSATRFHDVALVATREAERRAELAALAPRCSTSPSLDSDIHDLAGPARRSVGSPAGELTSGSGRLDDRWPRSPPSSGEHTTLDRDQIVAPQPPGREWGMLADFCFADLLLYVPDEGRPVAGRRPGPPGDRPDHVPHRLGRHVRQRQRAARCSPTAFDVRRDRRGRGRRSRTCPTRPGCWPSRCAATAASIAVLTREWSQRAGRQPGELERTYLSIFDRFAGDDRRGHVPVPGPRRRLDRGAPRSATA